MFITLTGWQTMIAPEEVGNIVARLAIHNERFLTDLLLTARDAGDRLLPDDLGKLTAWAAFMRALRASIQNSEGKT